MIDIQPHEAITQCLQVKHPGPEIKLNTHEMVFRYTDAFKTSLPEAYETLLLDVVKGDATLFMRADQVEYAWMVVAPVLKTWEEIAQVDFPNYTAGSWGPESAETLIARDGRSWVNPVFIDDEAKER
jgi:glucose-6-phosphate 1-dehydrogenase